MRVILAGAVTGNLNPFWRTYMKIYLASPQTRPYVVGESMKKFLEGEDPPFDEFVLEKHRPHVLESFFYIKDKAEFFKDHPVHFKSFMLDSGAFTFMNQSGSPRVNWNAYADEYSEFIKATNSSEYLELDLDSLMPLKDVEKLRKRIESRSGIPCIPVWHRSRGLDYWKGMIKDYKYVAIGGIVSGEIKRSEFGIFPKLIRMAHEEGCRVHGLGFTNLKHLPLVRFDSVDSTAWISGNQGGFIFKFNGKTLDKIEPKPGQKIKSRICAINNFHEWVKFSKYAEQHF